ncbi:MAG: hypothetical protein P857_732 [Candidatus Xenolissoclinum pacificiensis L6]|uniref:Uncharacterized protein n=1 Tax=Candidatus Xenolissoclinum pacificiensis L6 TaxID=1401685 RepID=W2UZ69_9RICK|nr:MAG: hypothetical protein P857_732 [Candidatus Xenolissoclinum pacificiensis L6]
MMGSRLYPITVERFDEIILVNRKELHMEEYPPNNVQPGRKNRIKPILYITSRYSNYGLK